MPETTSRMANASTNGDGFYSTPQVSRLAGVPRGTLYAWKRKGIIRPTVQIFNGEKLVEEGYSYADLAIVKLLRGLRNKQLNMRVLAVVLRHLFDRLGSFSNREWEESHLYVLGKEVYAQKPDEWDTTVATRHGQKLMLRFPELFEEEAGILIPRDFDAYVEINPEVMDGQPVVRNTRLPTTTLAMMHEQGASYAELAELYAPIPRKTIEKAIQYEHSLDKAAA